ncbi:hypothetical protein FOCC_FOCC014715 [Frankliniella occidentalis]|nr:hypothetical protein FOCC_FOCC014715 [Frankliniella occidentalis]
MLAGTPPTHSFPADTFGGILRRVELQVACGEVPSVCWLALELNCRLSDFLLLFLFIVQMSCTNSILVLVCCVEYMVCGSPVLCNLLIQYSGVGEKIKKSSYA